MDLRDIVHHANYHQVRRVLKALGPERIEKALSAFDHVDHSWSGCFFARAFKGERGPNMCLRRGVLSMEEVPLHEAANPEYWIMHKLGIESPIPIRITYFAYDNVPMADGVHSYIGHVGLRKFTEEVLDEFRPEVVELLNSIKVDVTKEMPRCPSTPQS